MRVRKLDEDGDMLFGHGVRDFWKDVPDAPAQCVVTRLRLNTGEWFLNLDEGTPWDTKILGKGTKHVRDVVIETRIVETQGVKELISYDSVLDRHSRMFVVGATIDTIYGRAALKPPPEQDGWLTPLLQ